MAETQSRTVLDWKLAMATLRLVKPGRLDISSGVFHHSALPSTTTGELLQLPATILSEPCGSLGALHKVGLMHKCSGSRICS